MLWEALHKDDSADEGPVVLFPDDVNMKVLSKEPENLQDNRDNYLDQNKL